MIAILMLLVVTTPTYDCTRATGPITIDGRADEAAWAAAAWTDPFVDIEGDAKPRPYYQTRTKLLWDDAALYVYAELDEPHVWATLRDRNAIIYHDNDFELFLDPGGRGENYYEFEVNALNTVMELILDQPYSLGGNYTFVTNRELRSAVRIDGTINDPSDIDRGWAVEIALPWAMFARHRGGVIEPPNAGDQWRLNFSRVQWAHRIDGGRYVKIPKTEKPEENWVWSPTGVIDIHHPDRWGTLKFGR